MISYLDTSERLTEDTTLDTAILPVGSVEQHSTHLPVGTDTLIVTKLAEAVAQRIHAFLLPTLPIGTCYEHKGTRGTVWMSPKTFYTMLQDIVLCLRGQGFHRVVVLLGHGGIFIAGPAIRELNAIYDDLQVIKLDTFITPAMREILERDPSQELHAGEKETSLMLYLHEDLVDTKKMRENDCAVQLPREYLNYTPLPKLSNTGAWGYPSYATREKGERLFGEMVTYCVDYIADAFAHTEKNAW